QTLGQFQPAYSPDGRWITFVSWDESEGGHVWRIPTTGGVAEQLTETAGYYQTPIWSPDGEYIVFVGSDDLRTKRSGYAHLVHGGTMSIISLSDRSVTQLAVSARIGHPPTFSGNGRR